MSEEQQPTQEEQKEKSPEEKQREEYETMVKNMFHSLPHAPPQEQIEEWKAKHGAVFVSAFNDDEVYIWRQLTRAEWIELNTQMQQQQQLAAGQKQAEQVAATQQYMFEEAICDACVLWKAKPLSWADGPAGTPSTLQEQIMLNSNFVAPQIAQLSVIRL